MKVSDFDYELPPALIAQKPALKRDGARLMLVDRERGQVEHLHCRDLPGLFSDEDLLVLNNTRVFPARLFAQGAQRPIEVLLVRQVEIDLWEALIKPGRKAKPGVRLIFLPGAFEAEVIGELSSAIRRLRFDYQGDFWHWVERLGCMPVPPYIRRAPGQNDSLDRSRYQTVYADKPGSIAAPTAGLHFTESILERVPHRFLTLHVGYGTFKPVTSEVVEEHQMEVEDYWLGPDTARAVSRQKNSGRPVTAVGTTTTRVLETLADDRGQVRSGEGQTGLFICPGFRFRVVDALMTNFHLPRSSLLLLVAAFAGNELIKECYRIAVEQRYRFYSYGDAMLIR